MKRDTNRACCIHSSLLASDRPHASQGKLTGSSFGLWMASWRGGVCCCCCACCCCWCCWLELGAVGVDKGATPGLCLSLFMWMTNLSRRENAFPATNMLPVGHTLERLSVTHLFVSPFVLIVMRSLMSSTMKQFSYSPHTSQVYGFSPVCIRMCMTSLSLRASPFPHTVQANAFVVGSPVLVAFDTEPGRTCTLFVVRNGWFTTGALLANCGSLLGNAGITPLGRIAAV